MSASRHVVNIGNDTNEVGNEYSHSMDGVRNVTVHLVIVCVQGGQAGAAVVMAARPPTNERRRGVGRLHKAGM